MLGTLENCEDLTGTVREEFVELLTEILRFAADRADIGRGGGGPDILYLFPPEEGKKAFTEVFLQRDVNSWLKSSSLRRFTRMEEPDVAAGRADVTVTQEHRFTIEVKRELRDASRDAILAAYGGQAAAYTVVGPRVSFAMILDLTDHAHGVPSLKESVWVDEVPISGGDARHVVAVVVRGNRQRPTDKNRLGHRLPGSGLEVIERLRRSYIERLTVTNRRARSIMADIPYRVESDGDCPRFG